MPLSPGDKLGHFEIVSLLGEGGMGVVYKARDPRLDRLGAIKPLTEARISDPDRRARFMQEARAASALNHPGIVTVYDIAEQDGRHYIVIRLPSASVRLGLRQRLPGRYAPRAEDRPVSLPTGSILQSIRKRQGNSIFSTA